MMGAQSVSLTIDVKDLHKILEIPKNTQIAKGRVIKRMTTSLSQRLRFRIPSTFGQRGKIGATGSLSNPSSWRATTEPTGGGAYRINVRGPGYAGYINRPNGPYPLEVNRTLLRSWLKSKGKRTDWGNVNRLALQIETSGHINKGGEGAIEEAVFMVHLSYGNQFVMDVNTEFNEVFK